MDQTPKMGRPRSEQARTAVLHAVDDLLVEVGYAAMTMKGIAERAGVGRQTVYRWWATKAEILFEASVIDAQQELAVDTSGDLTADVAAFLERLALFFTTSPAGAAYRALLGEAQHDPAVAALVAGHDVVATSARNLLLADGLSADKLDVAAASLAGPLIYWVLAGHNPAELDISFFSVAFTNQYA